MAITNRDLPSGYYHDPNRPGYRKAGSGEYLPYQDWITANQTSQEPKEQTCDWFCGYCRRENKKDKTECFGCGAVK